MGAVMLVIIDNVVDTGTQNLIENCLLNKDTQWKFSRFSAYRKEIFPDVTDEQRRAITAFNHLVFDGQQFHNGNADLYKTVVDKAAERLNFQIKAITNIRSNLQLPVKQILPNGIPHVDKHDPEPYLVCVYYVNNSDGDTVIYKDNTFEEFITVTPKKGRCVVFDGNLYHKAGMPTEDIRCILNYNFYIEKHEQD